MDGKIGRTNIVPDIRPENIDTYTETNTQEDGMEQADQYKIVDANPIIGGVLDRLAFFRTHASAVWYNKMKNITVLQKLDNLAGNIGTLTQLATTDKTSLVNAINELNANIGKKQDASTAITTGNIGQQSVKHATTAGSSSAVAWGNVSGKPGTYPPSGHNHDDRYYTETEVNNLLAGKVKMIVESLNYHNDGSASYSMYFPPSGYKLVSAILLNAPTGYLGINLIKRGNDGSFTVCLNWGYEGAWATQLVIVKE